MSAAATFRERVTIYTPASAVPDGMGGRVPAAPEASLETWASVQQLQAKVFFEEGKMYTKKPYRVTLRYVNAPTLQFSNRVEWNGVKISVTSVTTDAKKTLVILYGFGN
jgi:SPP1 family predicted phage head-tail adaptor